MEYKNVNLFLFKCPIHNQTFRIKDIKDFVEQNSFGKVLNLFCGSTLLNLDEWRNDIDKTNETANSYQDALDLVKYWPCGKFDTIILDPPYSYRKSMEYYKGNRNSRFKLIKDYIPSILKFNGKVITLGYQSVNMGKNRGFEVSDVAIFSHGGATHDTICTIEEWRYCL